MFGAKRRKIGGKWGRGAGWGEGRGVALPLVWFAADEFEING